MCVCGGGGVGGGDNKQETVRKLNQHWRLGPVQQCSSKPELER